MHAYLEVSKASLFKLETIFWFEASILITTRRVRKKREILELIIKPEKSNHQYDNFNHHSN